MRNRFIKTVEQLAQKYPKLFFITGDLGFKVVDKFAQEFPRQYLNVGVAEQNMIGVATGLALEGRTVFVYSIGNFPTLRCLEHVRNDALYHDANVKIVAVGGGFSYGPLGFSHHAVEDLSIMRALPGATVVIPGDLWEVQEATKAIFNRPGTCYLRIEKATSDLPKVSGERFVLGKGRCIRKGNDITIIAAGSIVENALKAAENLEQHGIQCRILSMHTIKPIDTEAICQAVKETGGILTVEENVVDGGLGSAVAETCLEQGAIPSFFYRIGVRGKFSEVVGNQDYLREKYGMDSLSIEKKAVELVTQKRRRSS